MASPIDPPSEECRPTLIRASALAGLFMRTLEKVTSASAARTRGGGMVRDIDP